MIVLSRGRGDVQTASPAATPLAGSGSVLHHGKDQCCERHGAKARITYQRPASRPSLDRAVGTLLCFPARVLDDEGGSAEAGKAHGNAPLAAGKFPVECWDVYTKGFASVAEGRVGQEKASC